jgi:hypothetical protein
MLIAKSVLIVAAIYLSFGIAFAVWFVFFRIGKFDSSARETSLGFRLLIIPGAMAFWWLLLIRILRNTSRPIEINAHRIGAQK